MPVMRNGIVVTIIHCLRSPMRAPPHVGSVPMQRERLVMGVAGGGRWADGSGMRRCRWSDA